MSTNDIHTAWLQVNANIYKYIQKRDKVEEELKNEISQLRDKIKQYEDGNEIESLKKRLMESEQDRDMYKDLFNESLYICFDCNKKITAETRTMRKPKSQKK